MQGIGIGCGVDGDRRYTEILRRANDAHCDLAAIGYQQLLQH